MGVATSPDAYSGLWNIGKVALTNQKVELVLLTLHG